MKILEYAQLSFLLKFNMLRKVIEIHIMLNRYFS